MTGRRGVWVVVLVAVVLAPGRQRAAGDEPEWQPAEADQQRLREVMRASRVETVIPVPGLGGYMRDLSNAFWGWLARVAERIVPGFGALANWIAWIGSRTLVTIVVVLLSGLLLLGVLRWWKRRRRPALQTVPATALKPAAKPKEGVNWEARLETLLTQDDARAALEALWWWLAVGLVRERADASWTSRELMTRAKRRDLKPQVLKLDRLIYGMEPPEIRDVQRLWGELREALG